MNRKIRVILGVFISLAAIIGLTFTIANREPTPKTYDYSAYSRDTITSLASEIDFTPYNPDSIIPPDKNSGYLPEKILGDPDAPVKIYEYADYACSHCAEQNGTINRLVREYDGKVAVVFRDYVLNFQNSVAVASAATAAANQNCWSQYKNLLFSNQSEWFYLRGDKLQACLDRYFEEASNGSGDLEKFHSDMESAATAKRLAFNLAAGDAVDLSGTPTFRLNGEKVAASDLRAKIDEILKS